jgi:hypothetical protein
LIAGWDFQTTTTGGTAVLASPNTPKVYNANFGSGAIYLDGTNNSSNWFVGASNSELTAFAGSTINAGPGFSTTTTSPACLALLGGVGGTASNGKFAIFSFSMVGYINLSVTYASQKSNTGFNTQIWEYSTDGINWTPLSTVTTVTTSFSLITLPTTGGLNGATTAYLRFSGPEQRPLQAITVLTIFNSTQLRVSLLIRIRLPVLPSVSLMITVLP